MTPPAPVETSIVPADPSWRVQAAPSSASSDARGGPWGPRGPAGPAGPAEPAGPAGPAAPAGPNAPTGPAGPAGPAGPRAPAGPVSPAGPAGPAGPTWPCLLQVTTRSFDLHFDASLTMRRNFFWQAVIVSWFRDVTEPVAKAAAPPASPSATNPTAIVRTCTRPPFVGVAPLVVAAVARRQMSRSDRSAANTHGSAGLWKSRH